MSPPPPPRSLDSGPDRIPLSVLGIALLLAACTPPEEETTRALTGHEGLARRVALAELMSQVQGDEARAPRIGSALLARLIDLAEEEKRTGSVDGVRAPGPTAEAILARCFEGPEARLLLAAALAGEGPFEPAPGGPRSDVQPLLRHADGLRTLFRERSSLGGASAAWLALAADHPPGAKGVLLLLAEGSAKAGPGWLSALEEEPSPAARSLGALLLADAGRTAEARGRIAQLEKRWLAGGESAPAAGAHILEAWRLRPQLLLDRWTALATEGRTTGLAARAELLLPAIEEISAPWEPEARVLLRSRLVAHWAPMEGVARQRLITHAAEGRSEAVATLLSLSPPRAIGRWMARGSPRPPAPVEAVWEALLLEGRASLALVTLAWLRNHAEPAARLARLGAAPPPIDDWLRSLDEDPETAEDLRSAARRARERLGRRG